jgi:CheY-like chemotaxis protein
MHLRKPSILVVHDDPFVGILIGCILGQAGYEVVATGKGEEDVRILGRSRRWFDLVIVGACAPDLKGAEAAASVHRYFPGRPILNMDESKGFLSADRLVHAVRDLTGSGPLSAIRGRLSIVPKRSRDRRMSD